MSQALTFTVTPNCSIFSLKSPKSSLHINNNNKVRMMRCRAAVQYAETTSSSRTSSNSNRAPRRQTSRSSSLYDILGLNHNASTVEIKSAYRNLAKLYHPDASTTSTSSSSSSSDGRDFIEIHNAYETLSNPTARALYDLSLGIGHSLGRNRYCPSSVSVSVGRQPSRRWETDQCW